VGIFTILVARVSIFYPSTSNSLGGNLLLLSLTTSLIIFYFQHKALRQPAIFAAWLTISIGQIALFIKLHRDLHLNYLDRDGATLHNYADGLKVPLILLMIFFLLRKIAKKKFGTELIIPSSRLGLPDYDEPRKLNIVDYTWIATGSVTIVVGHYF
jgi:hypothetical protein